MGVFLQRMGLLSSAAAAQDPWDELISLATAAGAEALYDPDNPNTWTLRNDGADDWYSAVSDGLGNREDLVQATAADQPRQFTLSNGRRVWETRGIEEKFYMLADFASAIAQPLTIVVVFQRDGNTTQYAIDSGGATGGRIILGASNATNGDMWAGAWITTSSTITSLAIWHANYDGAASEMFINGASAQTGDPGANALGGLGILNQNPTSESALQGVMGPIIVFAGKKTNAEISDIRDHFNANWPIGDTV